MDRWLGVDVGGKRKGFDIALIDEEGVLALKRRLGREAVLRLIDANQPIVVAIDSPRCCAPEGRTTREGERELNRKICGIRWTPDESAVHAKRYYAWIIEGLGLYRELEGRDVQVIEVFPTASWTRWYGKRSGESRAVWSRQGLLRLSVVGTPARTNQDQRDAIAAAVTARQHTAGMTEAMGEIVVPATRNAQLPMCSSEKV